jgi:hypothetical protein
MQTNRYAVFVLPCYIIINRVKKGPKKIPINMNWARTAFRYEANTVKQMYAPIKMDEFHSEKIKVRYTLILPNDKRTDVNNWCAQADKFFMDWLVKVNFIPDDSHKYTAGTYFTHIVKPSKRDKYIIATVFYA